MRLLLPVLFSCLGQVAISQITITTNHLPDAGDTIVTRNAMFSDGVDLEATGPGHTWNFTFDELQPLNLNPDIICYDVDDTPVVYQFMFNNPFDAAHNSDFGVGVEEAGLATLSFENAYMYYQNSPTKYTITGMGATINGLPLAAHMNEPDLLYNLPLTFGSLDTSHTVMTFDIPQLGYYGLDQTRSYECDGWGTLNIWEQSFQVLRVRLVVNATDSIFTSFINMGIRLPRPETITYEWISQDYIEPILKVTTTEGVATQVQVADIYQPPTRVEETDGQALVIYPNPATDKILISSNGGGSATIYDSNGRAVASSVLTRANSSVDVNELNSGIYTVVIRQGQTIRSGKFLKQ